MQQLKTRKYSQPYPQQGLLNIGKIVKEAYDRSQMTLRDFSQMVCERAGDEKALDKDTLARLIKAGQDKGSKGRDFWRLSAIAPFTFWEEKQRPFTEEELYDVAEGGIDPFAPVRKATRSIANKKTSAKAGTSKPELSVITQVSTTEVESDTSIVKSVCTIEKPSQQPMAGEEEDRVPDRVRLSRRELFKLAAILTAATNCDRQTIGKWIADRGFGSNITDLIQIRDVEFVEESRDFLEKLYPFLYKVDLWIDEGDDNWRAVLRRPIERYMSLEELLRDIKNGLRSTKA